MEGKRKHERRRVFKGGKIVLHDGRSVINCTIRNLSVGGATLEVESPLGIPDRFGLIINPENIVKACRLAWKKEKLIGVSFEGALNPGLPPV